MSPDSGLVLEDEAEAAADGARGVDQEKVAAVGGANRQIALGQQVPQIGRRFQPTGHAGKIPDGLAQVNVPAGFGIDPLGQVAVTGRKRAVVGPEVAADKPGPAPGRRSRNARGDPADAGWLGTIERSSAGSALCICRSSVRSTPPLP